VCWKVSHCLATYFSYLGLQVALGKLRPPLQHPGPWAGTIAFSCKAGVGVTCPEGKWLKAKTLIAELQTELQMTSTVSRKPLESVQGFLIHLMWTFPIITPYLKACISHLMDGRLTGTLTCERYHPARGRTGSQQKLLIKPLLNYCQLHDWSWTFTVCHSCFLPQPLPHRSFGA
jgi:hypothetical protein